MTAMEAEETALHAYHDGELGRWGRYRFEARLRRQPTLQRQLDELRAIGSVLRESEAEAAVQSPGLWAGIEAQLPAAGAAAPAADGIDRDRGWALLPWRPLATGALAVGLAAWAVFVFGPVSGPGVPVEAAGVGAVRYLDTGGQPVMVDDSVGLTIIWLMDSTQDAV